MAEEHTVHHLRHFRLLTDHLLIQDRREVEVLGLQVPVVLLEEVPVITATEVVVIAIVVIVLEEVLGDLEEVDREAVVLGEDGK